MATLTRLALPLWRNLPRAAALTRRAVLVRPAAGPKGFWSKSRLCSTESADKSPSVEERDEGEAVEQEEAKVAETETVEEVTEEVPVDEEAGELKVEGVAEGAAESVSQDSAEPSSTASPAAEPTAEPSDASPPDSVIVAALAALDALPPPPSPGKHTPTPTSPPTFRQRHLARILLSHSPPNAAQIHSQMTGLQLRDWIAEADKALDVPASPRQLKFAWYLIRHVGVEPTGMKKAMTRREMTAWLKEAQRKAKEKRILQSSDPTFRASPATARQVKRMAFIAPHLPSLPAPDSLSASLELLEKNSSSPIYPTLPTTRGEATDYLTAAGILLRNEGKAELLVTPLPGEEDLPASLGQVQAAKRMGLKAPDGATRREMAVLLEREGWGNRFSELKRRAAAGEFGQGAKGGEGEGEASS